MVINKLNIISIAVFKAETDSPFIVYANTVLPNPVTIKLFKVIGWWHSQAMPQCEGLP